MSASREKKMRQNLTKTEAVAASKKNGKIWKTVLAVALVVVILATTVFFTLLNNGSLNASLTALTIDSHKVSPAMLNYFYVEAREELRQTYGEMWSMIIRDDIPLSQQACIYEEYETWGDYVVNIAMNKATQMYKLCDDAEANGFSLSEETLKTLDEDIENLELYAGIYGYPSVDGYLSSSYGTGCNLDNYREFMEIRTLANEYSAAKINDLTYSPEKVDEYYNQNKKDFYEVSFQTFDITADMMENADSALADCEAAAKEMAESITDVESFNELCKEYVSEDRHHYYDNGAITFNRDKVRAEVAEESADWLFSDDRKPGDTTYIAFETEEKTGYHVLHFVEKTDMNYKVVSYHQILIETTSDNEDILAAAEAEAMDILNEFQNADAEKKTENGFLSLISQYSQASSSASSYNGSYTNARHGAISNEFDQWLFDKERQAGDVAILKSEQGYHVVYFSGHGDTYYNYKITEKMRSIDFNAWVNGILENTNINITDFAAKMVNRY